MSEVVSLLKEKGECGCGCGAFGTLRSKPWRNGVTCVSRGCDCVACRGKRNRRKGLRKQNEARKALGVPVGKFGSSNEETWADGMWASEVKSGAQVGPVVNWWRRVEAQVRANEVDHGDRRRPVRAVAMPDGVSDGLVVVRLSAWDELIRPALEEFYDGGVA